MHEEKKKYVTHFAVNCTHRPPWSLSSISGNLGHFICFSYDTVPPSYIYSLCDTHRWHFSFINVLWTNHHVYVKHTQSIKPSSPQPLTGAQFDSQMHSSSPKTGASMTDRDATQQPKQVQNNVLSVSFPPQTLLTCALLFYPHRIPCGHTYKKKKRQKETHKACCPIVQSWHCISPSWATDLLLYWEKRAAMKKKKKNLSQRKSGMLPNASWVFKSHYLRSTSWTVNEK